MLGNRAFGQQWTGKPIHPDTVTSWFHDFIARTDLPSVSIHSLRHTNATLLIAAGVNIKTVSAHWDHAQPSAMENIHMHALQFAEAAAAQTLENCLNVSTP